MTPRVTRTMMLWLPDWPVTAAATAMNLSPATPTAIIEKGRVFACSASARRDGVARGMRVREAQSRCQGLEVHPHDPGLDNRAFEPVISAVEDLMPGVHVMRPGLCAVPARGPGRYYGGERPAALALLQVAAERAIGNARVGIADGPFTAEHAARSAERIRVVPEGESAAFLARLPVGVLEDPPLVALLHKLGLRTLGDFAALPLSRVAGRFGPDGVRLHALAGGLDSRPVTPRVPPRDFDSLIDFEPPLDRVDQVAFSCRVLADRFIERLIEARLVCTGIVIQTQSESGEQHERSWLHPRVFSANDVIDRLRWQLQGGADGGSGLSSALTRVRIVPQSVDSVGNHEHGLWGTGPDERVHHGLSRVQSMLGHEAVLVPAIGGGRMLAERQQFVPWGDRTAGQPAGERPWPGHLSPPLPATVFADPRPVDLVAASGEKISIDPRGNISAAPAAFSPTGSARELGAVLAWAGPWPVDQRWWDPDGHRRADRFQVVDSEGIAWLLLHENRRWWAEARYD